MDRKPSIRHIDQKKAGISVFTIIPNRFLRKEKKRTASGKKVTAK